MLESIFLHVLAILQTQPKDLKTKFKPDFLPINCGRIFSEVSFTPL